MTRDPAAIASALNPFPGVRNEAQDSLDPQRQRDET